MPFSQEIKKTKAPPPETTHEEAGYLKMLVDKQRPVTIKMKDNEIVHGWIEYYDRTMLRLTRQGLPNLFIYKDQIAYLAED